MKKNTKILIINWDVNFARRDEEIFKELGYDVEYFKVHQRDIFNPKIFWKLYKKAKEADILFSWWATNFVTVFLSKITGTPSIIVAGGGEVETLQDIAKEYTSYSNSSFFRKLRIKFVLRFADKVISVSNYAKESCNKIVKRKDNEVVYNIIDTDIFKPKKINKKNYILTVAYIKNSVFQKKGFIELLEAFAKINEKHPEYKLIYLGNEKEKGTREVIKKKVKELGISDKVIFLDFFKTTEEYADFLNQCKIYVQYSWNETFGVAMCEAMACGVPVVASNRTALPEVVGDAGLIADRENINDLAEKIEMLINDEHLINELSRKGVERVRNNFSKEIRKQKLKKIVGGIKNEKQNT